VCHVSLFPVIQQSRTVDTTDFTSINFLVLEAEFAMNFGRYICWPLIQGTLQGTLLYYVRFYTIWVAITDSLYVRLSSFCAIFCVPYLSH